MSIQYTDGSFSENMPLDEATEEFQNAIEHGLARALYIGTENELNQIKKKQDLEDQIKALSSRIEKLEEDPNESDHVIIPTRDEIIRLLRKDR